MRRKYTGKSSIFFLAIIDWYPGNKTCILSTLQIISKLANKQNITPVVTFDQSLFWKASQVQYEVSDRHSIQDVVLLLGIFHTFMNLLGATGTLVDGSGLTDILETIYGKNSVVHMSGKATQRSFRGHLLARQWLTNLTEGKISENEPEFAYYNKEIERLYAQIDTGKIGLDVFIILLSLKQFQKQ